MSHFYAVAVPASLFLFVVFYAYLACEKAGE